MQFFCATVQLAHFGIACGEAFMSVNDAITLEGGEHAGKVEFSRPNRDFVFSEELPGGFNKP